MPASKIIACQGQHQEFYLRADIFTLCSQRKLHGSEFICLPQTQGFRTIAFEKKENFFQLTLIHIIYFFSLSIPCKHPLPFEILRYVIPYKYLDFKKKREKNCVKNCCQNIKFWIRGKHNHGCNFFVSLNLFTGILFTSLKELVLRDLLGQYLFIKAFVNQDFSICIGFFFFFQNLVLIVIICNYLNL